MEDQAHRNDRALTVRLDLYLDREPICGRLRTMRGADERFVGWLGFARRVEEVARRRESPAPLNGTGAGPPR